MLNVGVNIRINLNLRFNPLREAPTLKRGLPAGRAPSLDRLRGDRNVYQKI
jgi:hypothetical protein